MSSDNSSHQSRRTQQEDEASQPLLVDPPHPRRRKAPSICRCACWILIILVLGAISLVVYGIVSAAWSALWKNISPHTQHRHNGTDQDGEAVIPLLSRDQKFDIALTVWLRPTEEEILSRREGWVAELKEVRGEVEVESSVTADEGKERSAQEDLIDQLDTMIKDWQLEDKEDYTPLFSDIVFKGVTLKDKNVLETVRFQLPVERFCATNISENDLWATVLMIPMSPSPFDFVTSWSYWIPPQVYRRPQRPWPFPLGSTSTAEKSMQDYIVEAHGTTFSLLRLLGAEEPIVSDHTIHVKGSAKPATVPKAKATSTSASDRVKPSLLPGQIDGDDDDDFRGESTEKILENSAGSSNSTGPKSEEIKHPFLITRTQLRVLDDQTQYSLKSFNKMHNELKTSSCGQSLPGGKMHRKLCDTSYAKSGPFQARLRLEIPKEDGTHQVARAYLPTILRNPNSNSILDLEPIPVNRSTYTPSRTAWNSTNPVDKRSCIEGQPNMEVEWHVSYSGRTPLKSWAADRAIQFLQNNKAALNSTELQKARQRDTLEIAHAIGGHQYHPDTRPRIRFYIEMVSLAAVGLAWFLDTHYWFTRQTSTGITVPASLASAGAQLIANFLSVIALQLKSLLTGKSSVVSWIFECIFMTLVFLVSSFKQVAQLRGAAQVSSVEWVGWRIRVVRYKPSHRERASRRLDDKTSWKVILIAFISLFLFGLTQMHELRLTATSLPRPVEADRAVPLHKGAQFVESLENGVILTALLVQFLLNERARSFAGYYKTSAYLHIFTSLLGVANLLPAVTGKWDLKPAYTGLDLLNMVVGMAYATQAWRFPKVPQVVASDAAED
ncbi:hypothetical protein T439DRAFT_381009 [Meredithblackwellia eburnea MCA 4105]